MSMQVICFDSCFSSYDFKCLLLVLLYLLEILEIAPLVPFSKNIYISGYGISSSPNFVLLSIAFQLKRGRLK